MRTSQFALSCLLCRNQKAVNYPVSHSRRQVRSCGYRRKAEVNKRAHRANALTFTHNILRLSATDLVDASYVAVLSAWRYKKIRKDLTIHDFFYALARLGGRQNRKSDRRPGWLVLWRGWMSLQHMLDGAEALKSCG